jgi:hypothetical protein
VTGQPQADPPKSPPADVGPGRIAWFDFNLPDRTEAIALVLDPAGHPIGMYSRTPLPSAVPPTK